MVSVSEPSVEVCGRSRGTYWLDPEGYDLGRLRLEVDRRRLFFPLAELSDRLAASTRKQQQVFESEPIGIWHSLAAPRRGSIDRRIAGSST